MSEKGNILLVGFGTVYRTAREKTFDAILERIKREFPGYCVSQAWTSRKIIGKVYEREGICIPTVEEAIRKMTEDEIQTLLVQPVFILDGLEYRALQKSVEFSQEGISKVCAGKPLLSYAKNIAEAAAIVLKEQKPQSKNQVLLLIGHGSEGMADSTYDRLDDEFRRRNCDNVLIGTLQGKRTLEYVIRELERGTKKDILMVPFMLTAGYHASRHIAGEQADSWKNRLKQRGYPVTVKMRGLAEYQGIQDMIIRDLKRTEAGISTCI